MVMTSFPDPRAGGTAVRRDLEPNGWPEPQGIVRFWMTSPRVLVLIGLATLKVR